MGTRHVVVVGASLGGLRTVQALRRLGSTDRITLVGDEDVLPYDRPPLSKDVLLGKAETDAVLLTSATGLDTLDVDLRLGTRATGLDLGSRTLRLADASGETELGFDELVIATGSAPRKPAHLFGLPGVHALRTLDDALAIRAAFEAGARVVVLGGGFVGAEVASSARALGLEVTVVDIAPALMLRGLGARIGARMNRIAQDAGVVLAMGRTVSQVVGTDRLDAVVLDDGTTLPADLLVVGLGTEPATGWLDGSGLQLDDGVVCDAYLAAAPGVHAVGDVARWHHPVLDRLVRAEHWTAAGEHADAVAATLTGTPTAADSVPYVWSDQFGHKVQVAGFLAPGDDVHLLVDSPEKFVAVAGSGDVQSAALALNAPGALVRQRIKLAARPPWPPETE